ncbi:3'-5' exonuclease [Agrobacterium rhizogenes]|uniref:3'-5' exonuclease n=1 Tax=Rhizobium rhizogenes TaxID=359 RepID=UPI00115F606C|nr:3'-5' exonuclease [Rhizobium rhizogenes]NTF55042.1 3'-5' exonuclease [Rhizobium rhizogenes]NTF74622.1 3'-5' exonuclease [Rhizobium rhizogenes]NTF98391.1 3'-5' exonuclease [Rhizobium rhizogenes]NTH55861.1 3'-5' exonuclease [Rhizobium rhizogenes]NTH75481.1 3'-5' exonuclease [Rhizobium rhizogenes]
MDHSAKTILDKLLDAEARPTVEAPRDSRGLYGLVDHRGLLRYIGSTSSANETFYKRIHQRHRTGSESASHYFSRMYNTGRMWRDRDDSLTAADGAIAKELRNAFVADHCRAVWVALPDHLDITGLERAVLSLAPTDAIAWNGRGTEIYSEPTDLVDATLKRLGWDTAQREAIERQRLRHLSSKIMSRLPAPLIARSVSKPFPSGEFRFFALDVETANADRSSICQIGVACVRSDNSIETWVTYVDPKTHDWSCTRIHGITSRIVAGAPTFEQVFPLLLKDLAGNIVFQHSGFDRSAIAAACARIDLNPPDWEWRDSVHVARVAWPELKGNGGHGLSSLKQHLGLRFTHHDAGEDARASAEVVLRAERQSPGQGLVDPPVRRSVELEVAGQKSEIIISPDLQAFAERHTGPPGRSRVGGSSSTMVVRPVPTNPIRDEMLARIAARADVRVHSAQRDAKGTKYISAFTLGGVIFVVDKMSAAKQPIWMLDRTDIRAYLDAEGMEYHVYTPEMGRNSNLHKLPKFKKGQLLRVFPTTVDEAMAVISRLERLAI